MARQALEHNHISDVGIKAFAGAIGAGALPQLRCLLLGERWQQHVLMYC